MVKSTPVQTAEFCKDCYLWSSEPKVVKLCRLHAATPGLLTACKAAALDLIDHTGIPAIRRIVDRLRAAIGAAEGCDAG